MTDQQQQLEWNQQQRQQWCDFWMKTNKTLKTNDFQVNEVQILVIVRKWWGSPSVKRSLLTICEQGKQVIKRYNRANK